MNYSIGEKICRLRKLKNITQTQLAQYLYVTPQTVSKWESGNGIPDIDFLPKIAVFFEVSLDYLFDIADKQRIKDVILKYSVLRDDYSYGMALSMIESVLSDDNISDADKAEYLSLKSHLYLQKSRDFIDKSIESIKKALEYPSHTNKKSLILQLYLLRLMNGEYMDVRQEAQNTFYTNPDMETLFVYLEVLTMINEYKQIIELIENDDTVNVIIKDKRKSICILIQYLQALVFQNEVRKANELYNNIVGFLSGQELFDALLLMAKLYSNNGDPELDKVKELAIHMLDSMDYNKYLKTEFMNQINAL